MFYPTSAKRKDTSNNLRLFEQLEQIHTNDESHGSTKRFSGSSGRD